MCRIEEPSGRIPASDDTTLNFSTVSPWTVISLGGAYGQLIHPVSVDGGSVSPGADGANFYVALEVVL